MIEYVIPDKKYEIGKVKVKTLRSTDAGVAFLAFGAREKGVIR